MLVCEGFWPYARSGGGGQTDAGSARFGGWPVTDTLARCACASATDEVGKRKFSGHRVFLTRPHAMSALASRKAGRPESRIETKAASSGRRRRKSAWPRDRLDGTTVQAPAMGAIRFETTRTEGTGSARRFHCHSNGNDGVRPRQQTANSAAFTFIRPLYGCLVAIE